VILQRLYVGGLPAFWSLDYVELNGLAFLQRLESAGADGRIMHEYVFPILAGDESETLASLNHFTVPCSIRTIPELNCARVNRSLKAEARATWREAIPARRHQHAVLTRFFQTLAKVYQNDSSKFSHWHRSNVRP
jgi:hypothetical protein